MWKTGIGIFPDNFESFQWIRNIKKKMSPVSWMLILMIILSIIIIVTFWYIASNLEPLDYGNMTWYEYWFGNNGNY